MHRTAFVLLTVGALLALAPGAAADPNHNPLDPNGVARDLEYGSDAAWRMAKHRDNDRERVAAWHYRRGALASAVTNTALAGACALRCDRLAPLFGGRFTPRQVRVGGTAIASALAIASLARFLWFYSESSRLAEEADALYSEPFVNAAPITDADPVGDAVFHDEPVVASAATETGGDNSPREGGGLTGSPRIGGPLIGGPSTGTTQDGFAR